MSGSDDKKPPPPPSEHSLDEAKTAARERRRLTSSGRFLPLLKPDTIAPPTGPADVTPDDYEISIESDPSANDIEFDDTRTNPVSPPIGHPSAPAPQPEPRPRWWRRRRSRL
jgi:hypothetical protein